LSTTTTSHIHQQHHFSHKTNNNKHNQRPIPSNQILKMKFTLASILPFAAAASAQNALRVEPLSVKILTESQTARIDFTVVDLREGQGGASTTCSTAWYASPLHPSLPPCRLPLRPQVQCNFNGGYTGHPPPNQPAPSPAPTMHSASRSRMGLTTSRPLRFL
jgi:hypothetical protein